MKKIILFSGVYASIFTALSFVHVKNVEAIGKVETPVVLELFTSQSCSSCPPADRLLEQLAKENDNIIALSCNVTYWNHLHWEDTLSKEFCTARQRDYVRTLKSRGPYTPQIVINGHDTMVGSRSGQIRASIDKQSELKKINLELSGNELNISLPETPSAHNYALHLIVVGESMTQDILKGENRGRKVHYTNPIQDIISLGTWDGTGKNRTYDISKLNDQASLVVLAQKNGRTGEIIAAGKIITK